VDKMTASPAFTVKPSVAKSIGTPKSVRLADA
jgi:hypothetical protein